MSPYTGCPEAAQIMLTGGPPRPLPAKKFAKSFAVWLLSSALAVFSSIIPESVRQSFFMLPLLSAIVVLPC